MALPAYKDIIDLIKKGSTIEAQEKIMELREASLEIQEENIQLRVRVKELEDILGTRQNLEWEPPYYWLLVGERKDGPFCQHCNDKEGQLVRLIESKSRRGHWTCKACKNSYTDQTYTPPTPPSRKVSKWGGM